MSIPKDQKLYDKIKEEVYKKYPIHSAYRSGLLVKSYKEAYEKKYQSKDAYQGRKEGNEPLTNWFNEKWLNQRGEIGYKYKTDIYRPTVKISDKTPVLLQELSKKQIAQARQTKGRKGRVKSFI